jgi:hypothetical protein
MNNPLVKAIEHELNQLDMSKSKLIHESFNHENFGNAEAIYEIGNLKIRIVRDRGVDIISLGSSIGNNLFYIDDVAVWMGWISFDDLLQFYSTATDFSKPPQGPLFNLSKALEMIARELKRLDKAFSSDELMSTHVKLKDVKRKRELAVRIN